MIRRSNLYGKKKPKKKEGSKKAEKTVSSSDNKYNEKSFICVDGTIADSILEGRFYDAMTKLKIPFDYQKRFMLMEGFRDPEGKAIKKLSVTPDFVKEDHLGKLLIIDTKGYCTEPSIIRYKLLEHQLQKEGVPYTLIFPSTYSQAMSCALRISRGMPVAGLYPKPY